MALLRFAPTALLRLAVRVGIAGGGGGGRPTTTTADAGERTAQLRGAERTGSGGGSGGDSGSGSGGGSGRGSPLGAAFGGFLRCFGIGGNYSSGKLSLLHSECDG